MGALVLAVGAFVQGPTPEERVADLVRRLGAEEPTARDEAQTELEMLDPSFLSLLEPLTQGDDPELTSRVRAACERIRRRAARERWLPPVRRVSLTHGTYSVGEVLDAVREQTGLHIIASSVNIRATVEVGWDGVPVLQALDDLCRALGRGRVTAPPAGGTEVEFYSPRRRGASDRPPAIALDGAPELARAISHWEQFRVEIGDVVVTRRRSFAGSTVQVQVQIGFTGQPGIRPTAVWGVFPDEIVDDRGQALDSRPVQEDAPEAGEETDFIQFVAAESGPFPRTVGRSGGFGTLIFLQSLPRESRRIARLSGRIRVSFPMDEVTQTLSLREVAGGAEVRLGAGMLVLDEIRTTAQQVHVRYRVLGARSDTSPSGELGAGFEFLDEAGNRLSLHGWRGGGNEGAMEYDFTVEGAENVAAVRVRAFVGRETIEVPFEFADLPIPGR